MLEGRTRLAGADGAQEDVEIPAVERGESRRVGLVADVGQELARRAVMQCGFRSTPRYPRENTGTPNVPAGTFGVPDIRYFFAFGRSARCGWVALGGPCFGRVGPGLAMGSWALGWAGLGSSGPPGPALCPSGVEPGGQVDFPARVQGPELLQDGAAPIREVVFGARPVPVVGLVQQFVAVSRNAPVASVSSCCTTGPGNLPVSSVAKVLPGGNREARRSRVIRRGVVPRLLFGMLALHHAKRGATFAQCHDCYLGFSLPDPDNNPECPWCKGVYWTIVDK